jgi:hypothetical protein
MNSKVKKAGRWIPSIVAALMMVMSASMKMSGPPELVEHYTQLGLLPLMKWLGMTELVFMALFLYPRTMKAGFLLLTAYLGGAIATELPHGLFFLFPAAILSLIWLAAYLRVPSVFNTAKKDKTFRLL